MRLFFGILIGFLLAVGIAAGAAYYAFDGFRDVGARDKSKDVTRTVELTDFDKIDVAGVYEINVAVGGGFSVAVSGAPSQIDNAEIAVKNGVLELGQETAGARSWRGFGLTATISMPSLVEIDIAGVAEGDITGVDAETFRADLSGVGDLTLAGSCGRLKAQVSGIGELDASDLKCERADIDVSGIGEASVYASEEARASVSGIGEIDVYGSPDKLEKDSSFLSRIRVK